MKLAKIFAVLAAVFLVGSVAIAALGPDDMSLGECITAIDKLRLVAIERFVRTHWSDWLWEHPMKGLLMRPVWLLPAAFGLVLAGAAATAATNGNALNSRRRRS